MPRNTTSPSPGSGSGPSAMAKSSGTGRPFGRRFSTICRLRSGISHLLAKPVAGSCHNNSLSVLQGGEGGPTAERWEGEVGLDERSGIAHLTPTLSAPEGGEGVSLERDRASRDRRGGVA